MGTKNMPGKNLPAYPLSFFRPLAFLTNNSYTTHRTQCSSVFRQSNISKGFAVLCLATWLCRRKRITYCNYDLGRGALIPQALYTEAGTCQVELVKIKEGACYVVLILDMLILTGKIPYPLQF